MIANPITIRGLVFAFLGTAAFALGVHLVIANFASPVEPEAPARTVDPAMAQAVPGQELTEEHVSFLEELGLASEEEVLWLLLYNRENLRSQGIVVSSKDVTRWNSIALGPGVRRVSTSGRPDSRTRTAQIGDVLYMMWRPIDLEEVIGVWQLPSDTETYLSCELKDGSTLSFRAPLMSHDELEEMKADVLAAAERLRDR